jgi:hypothetical protein
MRLIITEDNQLVADVRDYDGPVPRPGDYIHHPRSTEPVPGLHDDGFMQVKRVDWGIIARPGQKSVKHFVGAAEPFVEVIV